MDLHRGYTHTSPSSLIHTCSCEERGWKAGIRATWKEAARYGDRMSWKKRVLVFITGKYL